METRPLAQSDRSDWLHQTLAGPAKNPIAKTRIRFDSTKKTTIWSTLALPRSGRRLNFSPAPASK